MDDKRIAAGIILFKPNLHRLLDNIKIIAGELEAIYLYNNGCEEKQLKQIKKVADNIIILGDGKNIGIAEAMNQIISSAKSVGIQWVITYDQDSISDKDMINKYRSALNLDNAAIICPQVIDKRRMYMTKNSKKTVEKVQRCITSASCTNVKAWDDVNGFDEFLFIDLVDNDFCKKIILNGWNIYRINSIVLDQEFGNIQLKNSRTVNVIIKISDWVRKLTKNDYLAGNIGKLSYKKNVSPMRVYYTNRNVLYLNKKYKEYGGIGYDCYKCKSYFGFQIVFNLASFLRGKDKLAILQAVFKGIRDGLKSSPEVFSAEGIRSISYENHEKSN